MKTIEKKRLKVIQLVPELNGGGVERGTLEVGKFLSKKNHESIVVSNGGAMVSRLETEGSRHIQMPIHNKNPLSLLQVPLLRRLIIKEKPNVVHARSRLPAWISYLAIKTISSSLRPKFVTTVHGFYSVNPYSEIMTRGDQVICVSKSIRDYVTHNYPNTPPQKLSVIYRGIESRDYNFEYKPKSEWLENWYAAYPKTKKSKILILAGRMTRLKGHQEFFKIIKNLGSDYCGIVAGHVNDKKEGYLSELKTSVKQLGIQNRVIFLEHRDDLKDIFSISSSVFSLSTKPESFGRVVLEALSLGTPVIGYDIGGVGEILCNLFPEGKVPTSDYLSAIDRIKWWEKKPVKPKENNFFQLEKMLSKTMDIYTQ